MVSIKQISGCCLSFCVLAIAALLIFTSSVLAEEPAPSPEILSSVSQNCSTIKRSLRQLQYADSRTRTYLGTAYETISTRFITPLNIRLVKNNRAETHLFQIQGDFAAAQATFRNAYTDYMRELETLLATDCQAHPEDFYLHLETTRSRRSDLQKSTLRLSELAKQQYDAVEALKGSL